MLNSDNCLDLIFVASHGENLSLYHMQAYIIYDHVKYSVSDGSIFPYSDRPAFPFQVYDYTYQAFYGLKHYNL